jgi:hypothetical protein
VSRRRRTLDNDAAREDMAAFLDDLRTRLIAGAKGSGATLTPGECKKLTAARWVLPPPRGRPLAYDFFNIAYDCLAREMAGEATKSAVAATAKRFRVSRSKVYAARKRLGSSK